jgi:hypothetical protein
MHTLLLKKEKRGKFYPVYYAAGNAQTSSKHKILRFFFSREEYEL